MQILMPPLGGLVLGAFFESDPANPPNGLKGSRNRLLLQRKLSSGTFPCTGEFVEATNFNTQEAVTRDVDIFDIDNDGALDIWFTNARLSVPGGNLGDQLLLNDGTGVFVDASSTILVSPSPTGDPHKATAMCDVNGDGRTDVIQAVNGGNRVIMQQTDGTFLDESAARGLAASTNFSHDVECHDWFLPDGSVGSDGFPEIIFARRNALKDILLLNDGTGHFTDVSTKLPDVNDTTQEVEVCDLEFDGIPEIVVGNGDILTFSGFANRVLRLNPATGNFEDVATQLGFDFDSVQDLTEDIECPDFGGDGRVDAVFVGNTGAPSRLFAHE